MNQFVFTNGQSFRTTTLRANSGELNRAGWVAASVARHYEIDTDRMVIAGHEAEAQAPGGSAVIWADQRWTVEFCDTPMAQELRDAGLFLEPISEYTLGVYLEDETRFFDVRRAALDKLVAEGLDDRSI